MLNTALLRCSVELVHSTGMAHVITHMQACILSSNWSLKLPSFPNIFSVYLAQDKTTWEPLEIRAVTKFTSKDCEISSQIGAFKVRICEKQSVQSEAK